MRKNYVEEVEKARDAVEIRVEVLARVKQIVEELQGNVDSFYHTSEPTDEQEQATDWQGKLRWEDDEETIPKMRTIWRDVELTEEQVMASEWNRVRIGAYTQIIEHLLKLTK